MLRAADGEEGLEERDEDERREVREMDSLLQLLLMSDTRMG